jgi:hypothetical protein
MRVEGVCSAKHRGEWTVKRILKYILIGAMILIWVAVAAFACELGQRLYDRRMRKPVEDYRSKRSAELFQRNDAFFKANKAPDTPMPGGEMIERESFGKLDEPGRAEFAAKRNELILSCDREGKILSLYSASSQPQIVALESMLKPGDVFAKILPETEGKDSMAALASVFTSGMHAPREYEINLPTGEKYLSEWCFFPVKNLSGTTDGVNVFVRDSTWEITWVRFRKNVFRNDAYVFQTNSWGFRDREFSVPKPDGVVRIACIGGSTTVEGPANEMTYPKMLERRLRDIFGEGKVEVINCGVFAITTRIELDNIKDALALQPDILIHYNYVNDVPTLLSKKKEDAERGVENIKRYLFDSRFLYRHFNWFFMPPERTLERNMDETVFAWLKQIRDIAARNGAELALCSFARPELGAIPTEERLNYDNLIHNMLWGQALSIESYIHLTDLYNAKLHAMCEREGMIYIPVAEGMRGGMEIFTDICHMQLEAMEQKARVVCDAIKDRVAELLAQKGQKK